MLKAKNIIYGFCKYTNPPKNKYLISLYRSDELHIIAVFPTSQRRAGVISPKHGCNMRDNQVISYVFEAGLPIGKKKDSDEDFAFPKQTTSPFDYCFKEGVYAYQRAARQTLKRIRKNTKNQSTLW